MRLANLAALIQPLEISGRRGMPGVRAHARNPVIECGGASAQCVEREGRGDIGSGHGDFRFAKR